MAKITLAQKAKKAGLPVQTVYNRRHAGWSEKKALSVPVGKYTKKSISDTSEKVAYKVKPKKVLTPRSRVKPTIPLPVEKFEAPKDKTLLYVAVACVVVVVLAVIANT
jgi:hypothetical protein